jgi:signal transduction histidine kinase
VDLAPVALAPLLHDCVEMVRPQADAAGVRIGPDLPGEALAVHADATRLRQVLLNLLSNAIKYNRRGGSVRVQAQATAGDVIVQVADTGVGIADADLPALFEPFNRGAFRHSAIEGTGIGLAVTRALVSLMRGHLEVRSTPGVGSTFSVTLPAA